MFGGDSRLGVTFVWGVSRVWGVSHVWGCLVFVG